MGLMREIGRFFGAEDDDSKLSPCDDPDVKEGDPCICPKDSHETIKGSECDFDKEED